MGVVAELPVKANDQAGLTYQAVNVEQTAPGKPSPNDRTKRWPSQEHQLTRMAVFHEGPASDRKRDLLIAIA